MDKSAVIIGAGIGGLATAIRLKYLGYQVTVFEKNDYPGGKLASRQQDGFRFDMGPSLFTMPNLVEELFELHGKKLSDYLRYTELNVLCRYFYPDGTQLTAFADVDDFIEEARQKTTASPARLRKYFKQCGQIYQLVGELFLRQSFQRMNTFLSWKFIRALLQWFRLDPFRTLHRANKTTLKNPYLTQLFDRYATYNGSSPYQTPATLKIIAHLEHQLGAFFPDNGMYGIIEAMVNLCSDVGIDMKTNSTVQEILWQKKHASGVAVNGTFYPATVVVSNADIVPTYGLLNKTLPAKLIRMQRSTSALVFYWGIKKQFPQLDLHNIFFSGNYKAEFEALFNTKTIYADPTVYIFISAKKVASDAPEGCENWFTMINVPENVGQQWDKLIQDARHYIIQKINRTLNTQIEQYIINESILDPRGIEKRTSSFRGSLYGISSNGKMAAFSRHPNFSRKIKNLYFAGGSVHPGGGIPLCINSARIIADKVNGK